MVAEMHEALKKYPLPESEQDALFRVAMVSEGLILAAGLAVAFALSIAAGGIGHAFPFGWLADIGSVMKPHWIMVALPIVMVVLLEAFDYVGTRSSESYRQAIMNTRRGITGEMPRMPMWRIALAMMAAGACEELLFRYGLLGLALWVLNMLLPHPAAAMLSVVAVSVVFWGAHVQYRDAWTSAFTIISACILGGAYLASGSLLSVMVAHAVYNTADMIIERRKMVAEADYFGGDAPIDAVARESERLSRQKPTERELSGNDSIPPDPSALDLERLSGQKPTDNESSGNDSAQPDPSLLG